MGGGHSDRHSRKGSRRCVRRLHVSAKKEVVELLRQRSRPYLFSNTLAPAIAGASLEVIKMLRHNRIQGQVHENTSYFRRRWKPCFDLLPGTHPIVPIMLYDARIATEFSARLLKKESTSQVSFPCRAKRKAR